MLLAYRCGSQPTQLLSEKIVCRKENQTRVSSAQPLLRHQFFSEGQIVFLKVPPALTLGE